MPCPLDSGSQSNFITRLSNKLKLPYETIDKIMGINNTPINAIQQVDAIIRSRTSDLPHLRITLGSPS